jgi:PAS domain S-box-containing protein
MLKNVLYLDDEEQNLLGFVAVFRKIYNIYTASTIAQALEILKSQTIQVLITDLRMPEEDGLNFIKRISPEYPNMINIILTAYSESHNLLDAINQGGVFRYILKPWNKSEMQMSIDNAFESYFLKQENLELITELKSKNLELQKSEEQFRNIFNTSVDSIFITDVTGKFLDINKITIEKTGIPKEQFLNMSIFDIIDDNAPEVSSLLNKVNEQKSLESSTSYFNKLLKKRIYLETKTIRIEFNGLDAFLHVTRDITDRHNMENKLLSTIIETEEKERERIARELHDGVSPVLAATRLYARLFTSGKDKMLEPVILEKLEETIDEAIQSVTEISNNLSPHVLHNFGLAVAIENFIEKLKNTQNFKYSVLGPQNQRLPENVETTLYRISVELINNTIKYADATEVFITFGLDSSISYSYTDNGVGFDWETISKTSKGMGFYNIMSRIKMLNGTVTVNSGYSPGMEVIINIPLEND